jgi:hypothetical protein
MPVRTRVLTAVLAALLIGGCTGVEQAATGTSVPPSTAAVTRRSCDALVGPEPWLVLFTDSYPGTSCVAVAVFQDLQIWNKGYDSMTVEWLGTSRRIASDERYATGPIGQVLEPGTYEIEASPYPSPDLRVVGTDESFSAETELTASGFGAIRFGMTLAQASEASSEVVAVDADLGSGPNCWLAVIVGDPYSPIFTVEGAGASNSVITTMTDFYPSEESIRHSSAAVPALCYGRHT